MSMEEEEEGAGFCGPLPASPVVAVSSRDGGSPSSIAAAAACVCVCVWREREPSARVGGLGGRGVDLGRSRLEEEEVVVEAAVSASCSVRLSCFFFGCRVLRCVVGRKMKKKR